MNATSPLIPTFKPALDDSGQAEVAGWLGRAQKLQGQSLRLTKQSAKVGAERDKLAQQIQTLRQQATKPAAAAKLPGLETRLEALNEQLADLENAEANGKFKPEIAELNAELSAIMRRVCRPSFDREVERLAEPLFPIFKHRQGAIQVVGQSDYVKFLAGQLFSELKNHPIAHAIRLAQAVLNGGVPFAYEANPAAAQS